MNEVERIYQNLLDVEKIVTASGDASAIASYGEHSAKSLLMAGVSYIERRVDAILRSHIEAYASSATVRHFAYQQAVNRKFFSLFDFSPEVKTINPFLSKFGPEFSDWAKVDLEKNKIDKDTQRQFLDFCRLRNNLTHNNYATYNIDKTIREVKALFDIAMAVVLWMADAFGRFEEARSSTAFLNKESS